MPKVKLFLQQTVTYDIEVELDVPDDNDLEELSPVFERTIRRNSDEGPEDVAWYLSNEIKGLKVLNAPTWSQYSNHADEWEMEYNGYETIE